jgi:hypothetical protein
MLITQLPLFRSVTFVTLFRNLIQKLEIFSAIFYGSLKIIVEMLGTQTAKLTEIFMPYIQNDQRQWDDFTCSNQ